MDTPSTRAFTALARAIHEHGWSLEAEIATLVHLARSDDPRVCLAATGALLEILSSLSAVPSAPVVEQDEA